MKRMILPPLLLAISSAHFFSVQPSINHGGTESELLCESEPAYETISEIQCESETKTVTENPGSYSNANTACYRSGNYGVDTGTPHDCKSLTKEQRIENLRVGFHKSAEENCALCDAKNCVEVHMGREHRYRSH